MLGCIKKISKLEKMHMCWWIFTGLNHIVLEGYFLLSPEFYKDKTHFYLAEVLKEYSKGDSRYARRDSIIVSVEGIVVTCVGFPALLAIYAIATKKSYRYLLQLLLSMVHLYSSTMIYVTAVLDGDNFAANPFYYYTFFVCTNSLWIVIPISISIYCWKKMDAAVQAQDQDQELQKDKKP